MGNNPIEEENEENFLINDLVQNKKLYLISNKPPKNTPIPESILKYEKDGMKIYSYPIKD